MDLTKRRGYQKKMKSAGAHVRPCIRCTNDFVSAGIHNRMCDDCKRGDVVTITVEDAYVTERVGAK
jgi:hypothetical protein